MIIKMTGIPAAMAMTAVLGFPASLHGAAVIVDWLSLAPGGTAGSFSLAADGGLPTAHGSLSIESGKGISFPGFPTSQVFSGGFWSAPTGFADSAAADERVAGFNIRVAPQSGMAAYTLTMDVPAGRELIVAVGGLFRGSTGATQSIAAFASGGGVVSLIQSLAWDGGSGAFDQELDWTAASGTLSTTVGSEGDSVVAFLHVGPLSGANPQLTFTVPSGYGSGSGDSIAFAIGTVVPEPGVLALAGLGVMALFSGRRR